MAALAKAVSMSAQEGRPFCKSPRGSVSCCYDKTKGFVCSCATLDSLESR